MPRAIRGSGIAEGDRGVAHQAAPLRALYGASAKDRAELFFVHRGQPLEARQEERFLFYPLRDSSRQFARVAFYGLRNRSWPKLRSLCHWCPAIPGTNVLANVAAEDGEAQGLRQFFWNAPRKLAG